MNAFIHSIRVSLTVSLSWPSALPTLCSTHCSPVNAILPNSRNLDGYPPPSKLVSNFILLIFFINMTTGQQLYINIININLSSTDATRCSGSMPGSIHSDKPYIIIISDINNTVYNSTTSNSGTSIPLYALTHTHTHTHTWRTWITYAPYAPLNQSIVQGDPGR